MEMKLGTARWADAATVEGTFPYRPGSVWLGRLEESYAAIGYADDRHVCLVSGSRAGKGTSSIVPNLCLWPGSLVVVDPKGENATITAPRRGKGNRWCEGMGQAVHVLDPFQAATIDEGYRSRFNPLDALDPESEESIDEAARLADALVVVNADAKDPFWDESARQMVKGLILHILTSELYEGARNLTTLRRLVLRGDTEGLDVLREMGNEEAALPSAHNLLWQSVRRNQALGGVIADLGHSFANMLGSSPKQYESVIQVVNRNTEFLDSPPMQRMMAASDFELADLKRNGKGMSLYLCLPQRYMNTHFRWLRMMIALTVTEMELVRGRPATGHPVLVMLDEFAGLRRMEVIESAVAQVAGYGVKLFFVLQSLEQLKATYKDNWETFLANAGLKVFFGVEDHFSREYISKLIGDTEVLREVRSRSHQEGRSDSTSHSIAESIGKSISRATSWGSSGGTSSESTTITRGSSSGTTVTRGTSSSTSTSDTSGLSETLHKRALISPDEIGHLLARIDTKSDRRYPGLCLAAIAGQSPILLRRVNYFQDVEFLERYNPHPDHTAARMVVARFGPRPLLPFWAVGAKVEMRPLPHVGEVIPAGGVLAEAHINGTVGARIRSPLEGRVRRVEETEQPGRRLIELVAYEPEAVSDDPFAEVGAWLERWRDSLKRRTSRWFWAAAISWVLALAGTVMLAAGEDVRAAVPLWALAFATFASVRFLRALEAAKRAHLVMSEEETRGFQLLPHCPGSVEHGPHATDVDLRADPAQVLARAAGIGSQRQIVWVTRGASVAIVLIAIAIGIRIAQESTRQLRAEVSMAWEKLDSTNAACATVEGTVGVDRLICMLNTATNFEGVGAIAGLPIFTNGAHRSGSGPQSDGGTTFGHYNEAFLEWVGENVVPVMVATATSPLTREKYDRFLKEPLRLADRVYRKTLEQPACFQGLVSGMDQSLRTGKDDSERVLFFGFFLSPNICSLKILGGASDDEEFEIAPSPIPPEDVDNVARFWARRHLDGTAVRFYSLLQPVMAAFDPDWQGGNR